MSALLKSLADAGKRTNPYDLEYTLQNYVAHPDAVRSSVAAAPDGTILGLQVLLWARENNRYGTEPGWGIIGTHVSPDAGRRGVGSALFRVSRGAAQDAGMAYLDAVIQMHNIEGQAYYEKLGFRSYRIADTAICKRYAL